MPSNVLYPSGSENLLKGNFHFCNYGSAGATAASSSYAALISSSYTYSAAHEFYSEISAHSCSAAMALTSVTCTTGTLNATDSTFSSVPTGQTVQHLVVFQSSSVASTDWLLAHFDTGSSGGINITTNGGDITITWNASGILALSGGC